MAYETGSASGQTDLISKLSTFAQANGYVEEYYNGTNRFLALSRAADDLSIGCKYRTMTGAIETVAGFDPGYGTAQVGAALPERQETSIR